MAELDYDQLGQSDAAVTFPDVGKLINIGGAIISLGLIAGLGWWGYQLVVRDVSGVPVVRALEGPMRVAPDDPGGLLATHTGLSVNNIPAEGIAEEPAERLALAPAAQELADEDQTLTALVPASDEVQTEIASEDASGIATGQATVSEAQVAEETASAPSAVEQEIGDLISAALAEATVDTSASSNGIEGLVSADLGGLTRSLVPVARPVELASVAPLPVASDGYVSIPAADIPPGTRLAQIGAFDTQEIAMQEWANLSTRFPEYMTDKSRVIETAQSGGKTFYRLRAHGFADLSAARRFCSALVAAQVNCIPVRQR